MQDHHKPGPGKEQWFHPLTTEIAKGKDLGSKRIELHHLLHQNSKTVDARAEVDRLPMKVDPGGQRSV